jgi:hypothetical protein
VDGQAAGIAAYELDLASVHSYSDRQTHLAGGARHRRRATHGPCGTVEHSEETVTGRHDLASVKGIQFVAKAGVVGPQKVTPGRVADPL